MQQQVSFLGAAPSPELLLERWQRQLARHPDTRQHDVVVLDPVDASAWQQRWQTAATTCHTDHTPMLAAVTAGLLDLPQGIHRIAVEYGRLYLTVCHLPWQEALQELHCHANEWFIPWQWISTVDGHFFKTLGLLSAWNAELQLDVAGAPPQWLERLPTMLQPAGWQLGTLTTTRWTARFAPPWLQARPRLADTRRSCVVLGAGLSGAAVAHSLALRGWQVTVLEQAGTAAGGASGLPAGLLVPYVSADDNPRARLTRAGVRWMLQQLHTHLPPDGHYPRWSHSGVQELDPDTGSSRWHAQAAWVQPAAVVQAWLQTPGITVRYHCAAAHVQRCDGGWQVLDAQQQTLASADVLVLANATGAPQLLDSSMRQALQLPSDIAERIAHMQAVHGTLSWAPLSALDAPAHWPPHPVNGCGSFISQARIDGQPCWMAGSTFETDTQLNRPDQRIAPLDKQHAANQRRLQQLLPTVAQELAPVFDSPAIRHWSATRCTSQDRLPLVGSLYEDDACGLWMVAAMGARGISLSALAAEWIAARLHQEPWPLERNLVRNMDIARPRRKRGGRALSPLTEPASTPSLPAV